LKSPTSKRDTFMSRILYEVLPLGLLTNLVVALLTNLVVTFLNYPL